ncbi:uncharacterized protein [Hyperolius riggenbachi]|uniref:uncharacterized protein n=1 Tax=Hyperolius riggenbachi TaxID=752182 RepID=UPI0035A341F9
MRCSVAMEMQRWNHQAAQLRDRSTVEWNRSFRENVDHILRYFLSRKKEVIVPVYVYSSGDLVTDERYKEMESFIREAHRITGIYPIIVLTKVKDNRNHAALYSQRFRQLGAVHIYQIENYTTDQSVGVPETRREILKFLNTCLEEADRRTSQNQMMDPQEEYIKNALEILGMRMKIETECLQEEKDKLRFEKEQMQMDLEDKERQLNELRERKKKKKCIVM